jgi:hypothetical protein
LTVTFLATPPSDPWGQKDQAGIAGLTFYEPDPLGVADRLLKVRARQPDVLTNVLSPPPRVRAAGAEARSWAMNAAAR